MNPKLHTALRIAFALFLIVSGAKHLYTVHWGDPTIMATGYPAGVLMMLPKRVPLGVLVAFPYSVGMCGALKFS